MYTYILLLIHEFQKHVYYKSWGKVREIIDVKVRYTQMFHLNLCQPAAMSGESQSFQECWREYMILFEKVGKTLELWSHRNILYSTKLLRSIWMTASIAKTQRCIFQCYVDGRVKLFIPPLPDLLPHLPSWCFMGLSPK